MKNKEEIYRNDLPELEAAIEEIKIHSESGNIKKILISSTLEGLRRVLEHSIYDIMDFYKYVGRKNYFPYGERKEQFDKSLKRTQLQRIIKDNPELLKLIESMQPYKSGDNWLIDLFSLTNESKHIRHNPISSERRKIINFGNFSFENCSNFVIKDGGQTVFNMINENNYYVRGDVKHLFSIVEGNKMSFSGKQLEIYPYVSQIYNEIKKFVDELYSLLK